MPSSPYLRSDDAAPAHRRARCPARHADGGRSRVCAALLADPDADIRLLTCELARALPATEATPLLCALLDRDAEPNVCAAAVDVLAEVGGPEALPALARCAERFPDDAVPGVRDHGRGRADRRTAQRP